MKKPDRNGSTYVSDSSRGQLKMEPTLADNTKKRLIQLIVDIVVIIIIFIIFGIVYLTVQPRIRQVTWINVFFANF